MKSRLKVLFFIAMILNLSTEISASTESEIAKANVKKAVMGKIGRDEEVNQGHINELADIETAKLEGKLFEELLAEGWSVEDATDMVKQYGLGPYGLIYHESRLHGSQDLEANIQKIKDEIERKQMAGKKITQRHFDKLAERETMKLWNQEYKNLMKDGYPSKLAMKLVSQRGLEGKKEVYDKLRKPHINLRTGSSVQKDLTIPKRDIIRCVEDRKKRGLEVTQHHIDKWAFLHEQHFRGQTYNEMIRGTEEGAALGLTEDRGYIEDRKIFHELRKPPIGFQPTKSSHK